MKVALLVDRAAAADRPDLKDALVQAETVREALAGAATEVVPCGLDLAVAADALRRARPDLVFNLVESVDGDGRLIHLAPALLDTLGIPYTGAPTRAMFLTTHKVLCKELLQACGLPTPPWHTLAGLAAHARVEPGPYIVKSVCEDASVGLDDAAVVEARGAVELAEVVRDRAARLGGEAFAEAYVEGREFNVTLLDDGGGARVLPIAEIHFVEYAAGKPRIVGYAAKWQEDSFEYRHTPRVFGVEAAEPVLARELAGLARACWERTGLRGYGRVDFRVDGAGRIFVLEVNANPCLAPDAGFLASAHEAGLTPADVVQRIVRSALA